jgi:integrase
MRTPRDQSAVCAALIATLALAGPRVGELCQLDNQDISLAKARFHIRDAKTEAGVRSVDIHPRLLDELTAYCASRATAAMDAPAFPTRAGTRHDRNNILSRVVQPVLARANELRSGRDEPPTSSTSPHTPSAGPTSRSWSRPAMTSPTSKRRSDT